MITLAENFSPEKLKAQLAVKGWSQAKLAVEMYKLAGRIASPVYPTTGQINRHVNGKQTPSLAYIRIYTKVLKCETADLMKDPVIV